MTNIDDDAENPEEGTIYTLLTNISFIQKTTDYLRLNCRALLFTEGGKGIFEKSYSLRGFGPEPSWDVFKMWLDPDKHLPFSISPAESKSSILLSKRGNIPIFSGNIIRLKDGTEFFIQANDTNRPIDIFANTGDIMQIWHALYQKTATYWHSPFMPSLNWAPPNPERTY